MKTKKQKSPNMLRGIAAAPGVAIGKVYLYSRENLEIKDSFVEDVDEAISILHEALERSKYELKKIFNIATEKMGEKRAAIFEAQMMVLDDPILINTIIKRIKEEKRAPEFIVNDEISKYQMIMASAKEPYMNERSHDIEDIKNRIIRNLQKKKLTSRLSKEEVIIVSPNLTPSDTIVLSRNNVTGYITDFGGLTSHAAIVARSLKIPAVVGTHDATTRIENDDIVIIDGFHGEVILKPTQEQLEFYRQKISNLNKLDKELAEFKDEPAITTDGREIILRGNIDLPDEIEFLFQNGAKGIGLLRTEQIFGELVTFPDEEEQVEVYTQFAEKVYPDTVIIRAFDVGGDKFLPQDIKEPNPFLGWRGIRFLLDNDEIFKSQIRAVLRASLHKNIKFMLPMISSISEIRKSVALINECKKELKKAHIKFDNEMNLGVMIEVPSAAVLSEEMAREVNFLSIGTNDLIQFMMAVDRGNDTVAELYDEFHPAIIKTIDFVIRHAKLGSAKVSMCGEMAADTIAVPLLVGMGLDSISASPSAIPYIKKIIRNISYENAKALAGECLKLSTAEEIKIRIEKFFLDNLIKETKDII